MPSIRLISRGILYLSTLCAVAMLGLSIVVLSTVGFVSFAVNLLSLCYLDPKFKRLPEVDNNLKNVTLFLALFNLGMLTWFIVGTVYLADQCGRACGVIFTLCSLQGIIFLIGLGFAVLMRTPSVVTQGYQPLLDPERHVIYNQTQNPDMVAPPPPFDQFQKQ